jgi:putative oxidoreductase
MSAVTGSDVARLLMRLGVGGVMMAHGSQKLFGWFGGGGLAGTAKGFESMGFKPGNVNAVIAGVTETGGGALLALGFATPSTGAAVASTMAVAAVSHAPRGFFAMKGGFEYPAFLGLSSAALAIAGAGKLSLDQVTGNRFANRPLAFLSIVATTAATLAVLRKRQIEMAPDLADPKPGQ